MERSEKRLISSRKKMKNPTLTSKNSENKKSNSSNKNNNGNQGKIIVNLLGHSIIPFDKKKIYNLIKTNLLKYSNSTEIYYKQMVNNILIKKSTIHCFYSEMLLNIENEEILNKFYPRKKSVDKLKFLGIINNNFLKPFPSYIGTGNEIYNLMLNNLIQKQELIDKIEDNIKKKYNEKNDKSIGFSFIGIELKDLKEDNNLKKKIKINCLNENDIVYSEEEKFCKELQKIIFKINNAKNKIGTIKGDQKLNEKIINDMIEYKEKKIQFKLKRNSQKGLTAKLHKTQENEMEKILERIKLNNQILDNENKKSSKEKNKKNSNSHNNNNLNLSENNNNNKRNSLLILPKKKFKKTITFLYDSRKKKRNIEEAEKVFDDILLNPVKSLIHYKEIKEKLNNIYLKNHKKNNFSMNLINTKNQIPNLKKPFSPKLKKNKNNIFLTDNFQIKNSSNYFYRNRNNTSENDKLSKNSNFYYHSSHINNEDNEKNKNNLTNNFIFKSVDSLETNFSNSMSNRMFSNSFKTFGNYNKYINDISKRTNNRNQVQFTYSNYVHNVELLSLIKINN